MAQPYNIRKAAAERAAKNAQPAADTIPQDLVKHADTKRSAKRREDERMYRLQPSNGSAVTKKVLSWTFQILLVVLIAYLLVFLFGQRRTNIGQSMDTTLSGGDEVLINTLAYRMTGPSRGDIISFKPNGNSSRFSIKRVIGLPGETIQIIDGIVYINGLVLTEDHNYPVISNPGIAEDPIRLGDTEYFVLGDNRNNSEDSRNAEIGVVTSDMIEGKVWFVISPSAHRGFVKE